jgi:NAD(P)-dependent dehydrogenase (short-subunit alcohol dehydrogenase family)
MSTGSSPYSARYPSLQGRGVYITGGSSGIGADLVRAFGAQGAQVAFNGRDVDVAGAVCDDVVARGGARPHFEPLEVADVDALGAHIERATRQMGRLDVLVTNVANDQRHEFQTVTREYFDWMVGVNLLALLRHPGGVAPHEGPRRRQHHQHRLDRLDDQGQRLCRLCDAEVGQRRPHAQPGT